MKYRTVLFATSTLILTGSASASNADYRNLASRLPCFGINNIQISDTPSVSAARDQIYENIVNKFTSYRVNYVKDCTDYPFKLHIQIQSTTSKLGIMVYVINLNDYDSGIMPGWLSYYHLERFGMAGDEHTLIQSIKSGLSEMLDQYFADYARANP